MTKRREGRGLHYRINPDMPLRHESQQDRAIGDLLEILGWKRKKTRSKASSHENLPVIS